ncbi:MAG: O-antigen ligase family protein [Armatimonadota bacterium]
MTQVPHPVQHLPEVDGQLMPEPVRPAWREILAGIFIIIGLCWPFVLSSVLPVRWWMFVPFAILGGLLRLQRQKEPWRARLPPYLFILVFLIYTLYAVAFNPLSEYGVMKIIQFLALAGMAYLATFRQAPLTEELTRGMRWTLGATLAMCAIVTFIKRDLFFDLEQYGAEELRQSFSTTGFPLAIALGATCLIPKNLSPKALFGAGALLLLTALLAVFVRGRYHAVVLLLLTVFVVLGPPWRNIFWRFLLSGVLVVTALELYVNVIPLLGDSFQYLQWMSPESVGGRAPLFSEAVRGYWMHPLGQGIGAFQQIEPVYSYPHNIILEVAYELGIFGLLCIGAIYLTVLHRGWTYWLSPPHRILGALVVIVFLHMLKAGDISTMAFQWVYLFMLLVGNTPACSWPLLQGRSIQ